MEAPSTRRLEQLAEQLDDPTERVHFATIGEEVAMARELLALRERDRQLGFEYDAARQVVSIKGTKFSTGVLEHYKTASGIDEYYQHHRTHDGVIYLTRFIGLREALRLLREALEARPDPDGITVSRFEADYLEWSEGVRLLLAVQPDEVASESQGVEDLIARVKEFRETAARLGKDRSPSNEQAQRESGGRMFGSLAMLELSRERLSLWGRDRAHPIAGVCTGCGCTDTRACRLKGGQACHWVNEAHTWCSACEEEQHVRNEHGAPVEDGAS